MKYEWRKEEKEQYLPKKQPMELNIPAQKFYTISGKGDPNKEQFAEDTAALYAMSYGIRMMHKNGPVPDGFFEYTVYPLEGIWTLEVEDIRPDGSFEKADLIYKLMIRQPEFVTKEIALANIDKVSQKKPNSSNSKILFEELTDGRSLQMLHIGPYDDEHITFDVMKKYCEENGLVRRTMAHKEIYLSDPRKSDPEKMKTVLRYFLK
ncbi:GyrI-like domain-containing protein [Enterococcus sp. BWT-B8]|uniref:GyrI-like domain-containing protein n=1 Tax=Enterococcus sp. BWT-B8 TaxID=2885157 RepID=UPI001E3C692A|nr:GyrI-like domain-containing protein [Enterococcus sp. BWT-B8]MCB5951390.1 GyrI-like domain-containing protein [Enterococcus sp. BWT-B8]